MDRREHLKLLLGGTLGSGFFMGSSISEEDLKTSKEIIRQDGGGYGRTDAEQERDERLHSESFFTKHELATVAVLSDIIIPADEVSGSATDADVPDFIEFMMKDLPYMQVPTRGGLMWLDNQCKKRFGRVFVDCTSSQQIEIIDEIAYPDTAKAEMEYGVRFFNRMRNLVATGFFTSEMGLKDMDYKGNRANQWNGVPKEVLAKHGLSYDQKTLEECVRDSERGVVAKWDKDGNLIRS